MPLNGPDPYRPSSDPPRKSDSYQAAAFLLRHSVLAELCDTDVLHDATEYIEFERIEEHRLSSGERVILLAALALYNGWRAVNLAECIGQLDDYHYAALVAALQLRRPAAFNTNLTGVVAS